MQKEVRIEDGCIILDVFSEPPPGRETIVHRTKFGEGQAVSLDKLTAMAAHAERVIAKQLAS